jgi:hypothetical protein
MRRLLLLVTLLVPLTSWASDGPATDAELKTALRRVLAHGDLSDLPFLSSTLGLGLRVARPDLQNQYLDPATYFRAIATRNPSSLLGSSLSYEAEYNERRQSSRMQLEFSPRSCMPLRDWGKEWNIPVDREFDPHGAGDWQELKWPGPEGVSLSLFHNSRGGCDASLVQITSRRVRFSPPKSVRRAAGAFSIDQAVDLLALRDLRDFAQVARILRTELIPLPGADKAGLLYKGSLVMARVIPGVDPRMSVYYGDDTGWVAPPSFTRMPFALAERVANLELMMDFESNCLSLADLESAVAARAINVSTRRPDGRQPIYSVSGEHRIELGVAMKGECVGQLRYRQVTDIAHSVKTPLMFSVRESLNEDSGSLTRAATSKIDSIMHHVNRLGDVPLKQVVLKQCRDDVPSAADVEAARRLADRIKDAFTSAGIAPEKIGAAAEMDLNGSGECAYWIAGELDGSGPLFVTVTVLID